MRRETAITAISDTKRDWRARKIRRRSSANRIRKHQVESSNLSVGSSFRYKSGPKWGRIASPEGGLQTIHKQSSCYGLRRIRPAVLETSGSFRVEIGAVGVKSEHRQGHSNRPRRQPLTRRVFERNFVLGRSQ